VVSIFDIESSYWEIVFAKEAGSHFDVHVLATEARTESIPTGSVAGGPERDQGNPFPGVFVHRFPKLVGARGRTLSRGVAAKLSEIQPAAVVIGAPSTIHPLPAVRWCNRNGVPYGVISGEYARLRPEGFARYVAVCYEKTIRRAIYKYSARNAASVDCSVAETSRNVSKATGRNDVRTLSLPVDRGAFRFDASSRQKVREGMGWSSDHVSMFCGKFERRKAISSLVQWWAREVKQAPTDRLVLVGASSIAESESIVAEIEDLEIGGVEILPFASPDELAGLYCGADLALFTSVTIGLQQALCTGLDVVVPVGDEYEHVFAAVGVSPIARIFLERGAWVRDRSDEPFPRWDSLGPPAAARGERADLAGVLGAQSFADQMLAPLGIRGPTLGGPK